MLFVQKKKKYCKKIISHEREIKKHQSKVLHQKISLSKIQFIFSHIRDTCDEKTDIQYDQNQQLVRVWMLYEHQRQSFYYPFLYFKCKKKHARTKHTTWERDLCEITWISNTFPFSHKTCLPLPNEDSVIYYYLCQKKKSKTFYFDILVLFFEIFLYYYSLNKILLQKLRVWPKIHSP